MKTEEIQEWLDTGIVTIEKQGYKQLVTIGFLYELFAEKIQKELRGMNGEFIYRVKKDLNEGKI